MKTIKCNAGLALTVAIICFHCTECFPNNISHRDMSRLLFPLMVYLFFRHHSVIQIRDSSELAPHLYICKATGHVETESQLPSLLVFYHSVNSNESLLCACREDEHLRYRGVQNPWSLWPRRECQILLKLLHSYIINLACLRTQSDRGH